MKKLQEENQDQLYINIIRSLVRAYGEVDEEALTDEVCIHLIDALDRLNASRVNHLISASDYIYDALRSHLKETDLIQASAEAAPDEPVAVSRSLSEVLAEHETIGQTPPETPEEAPSANSPSEEAAIQLEDAILGKAYKANLNPDEAGDAPVYNARLEGIGAAQGLAFSVGNLTIEGEPEETGNFTFQLGYLPGGALHRHQRKVRLKVIPDFEAIPDTISLPDASAHEHYSTAIDIERRDKFGFRLKGMEESGLELDSNNLTISGTPILAGKLQGSLYFKWKHPDGAQDASLHIELTVKADDRRFWKDIPPESNQPYPKSPVDDMRKELPHGRVLIGGSKRGPENAHRGLHRNDDFRLGHEAESGWMVMAVADGLGDAPYSRKGAELACKVAEQVLLKRLSESEANEKEAMQAASLKEGGEALEHFLQYTMVTATYNAYRYIVKFAASEGHPPEAFGTTLRLLISKQLPDKQYFVAGMGIGDGITALYKEEQKLITLLGPQNAETEDNVRVSLLRNDISGDSKVLRTCIDWELASSLSTIVMATNGWTRTWFKEGVALDDAFVWQNLWSSLSNIRGLAKDQQLDVLTKILSHDWEHETDDRTLALWI